MKYMSIIATKLAVRVVISLELMGGGMFILISPSIGNGELEKAAFTWIGIVTGYWLR